MNFYLKSFLSLFLCFFLICLPLTSCGGSSGGSDSDSSSGGDTTATASPTDAAVSAAQGLTRAVGRAGTEAVDQDFANTFMQRQLQANLSVACVTGILLISLMVTYNFVPAGRVLEDAASFSADGTATAQSCNGFDGQLSASMTGSADGSALNYTAAVDGTVTNSSTTPSCTVSVSNFEIDVAADYTTTNYTAVLTGIAVANCGDQIATCNWNGVDSTDTTALAAACI